MPSVPEVRHTRFDLRLSLCGVPLRINPFFWVSNALLGLRYGVQPEGGSIGYFTFWMLAVFASVLAHNLGQVLVGRLFGMKGEVVLSDLGGFTLGITSLPRRWQRLLVLLSGPLVNVLIVLGVLGLTWLPFPTTLDAWGWTTPVGNGLFILARFNAWWAVLTLLPLWPLNGGQLAGEIGEGLLGPLGWRSALGLCILVAGLLAVWVTLDLNRHLANRFDPNYAVYLEQDAILLLFCFILWLRGFLALWPEQPTVPPRERSGDGVKPEQANSEQPAA